MTDISPIALAIENSVVERIYDEIEFCFRCDGQAFGNRVVTRVVDHFAPIGRKAEPDHPDITPVYVSGLLWELINTDKLNIDSYGMVTYASAAHRG